ncbi:putative signal peptide protein [Puccinia sorghi]|uniref:Putative signal peptide protein n=1 Tax=Puccinia sorghi TaxID=27349 RepID=A0A0L6UB85_9BASI|nr:putative signal peptide protein [Puccinia sorghi]
MICFCSFVALSGAAADAIINKNTEKVDILMNFMSETAFKAIITPDNEENRFEIWNLIYIWRNCKNLNPQLATMPTTVGSCTQSFDQIPPPKPHIWVPHILLPLTLLRWTTAMSQKSL